MTEKSPRPRDVVFVMTGASSLPGGIAAVNLNILLALGGWVEEGRIRLRVESLLETDRDRPASLPAAATFRGYAGSKARLALTTLREGLRGRLLLYERVGLALGTAPLAAVGLVKTVIVAHGWENWRNVRRGDLWSLRGADRVLTNSTYTLRRMEAYPPLRGRFRGTACPLGLSPSFELHEAPPATSNERMVLEASDGTSRELGPRVLLLVGRMDPTEREKGHDQLLEAMPRLLSAYPDVQYVFAGPGDDRPRLAELAAKRGVAARVFFPGRVPAETLAALYRRAYAFVMPSRQEGFGLVYLEAMNAGLACLGCRADGAEDVIVHGETGVLVDDQNDIDALVTAIGGLLDDPERTHRMGRAGFERLHREFTAEQFRNRFLEAFSQELS